MADFSKTLTEKNVASDSFFWSFCAGLQNFFHISLKEKKLLLLPIDKIEKIMHKITNICDNCSWFFHYWAVLGCTNAAANNYDASATADDGSCIYGNLSKNILLFSKIMIK